MLGATDSLQQRGDRTGGGELANQIDGPNIDSKFERRGRNQRFQLAALKSIFGLEPQFRRKTPVMRRDCIGSEKFAQMMGYTFGHATRVHEHERRPMFLNQFREPGINFLPNVVRHHRFERRFRNLDREIDLTLVSDIDDGAAWISIFVDIAGSNQKPRDFFDWFLGCGKSDALKRLPSQRGKSL